MSTAERVFLGGCGGETTWGPTNTEFWRGRMYPGYPPEQTDVIVDGRPRDIFERDDLCGTGGRSKSRSTSGQEPRCCWMNFGWYGSSIRILPHRWKNRPIAQTHSTSTKITIRASSGLTTMFGPDSSKGSVELCTVLASTSDTESVAVSCTSTITFSGPPCGHPVSHSGTS